MSRKLVCVLAAFIALNGFVVGSTLGWPNVARSSDGEAARADAGRVGAEPTMPARRTYIPAFLQMIDFERHFTGANALPRGEYVPVTLTAIDFGRVFDIVAAARRANTPPNREKLRNAGWKRILGTS
jgi:hypothetical protein